MHFLRKHLFIVLAILISLFVGRALLTTSHFHTHDDLQVFRLNEYISCINDGQLPCRWSSEMGKGYGYPYFVFYPPAIYAIPAAIHLISGLSLIASLNLFAYLTFPLAALGMYLLIRELTGSKYSALIASTLYTIAPAHALNVFVRGVYAENLAWSILPYLLYFSYQLVTSRQSFLKLTLATSLLLLTHNISAMLILPLISLWVIILVILKKDYQTLLRYLFSVLLAIGLSAFFFLPAIIEKSLVQTDSMVYGYYSYLNHFVSLKQIFLSNYWGFGGSGFGTEFDEMSFAIGHTLTIGTLLLTPLALLTQKLSRQQLTITLFFPLTGLFTLLMMHNQSTPVWELFPLLSYIQFPWRLLGIATTLLTIGVGYNLSRVGKRAQHLVSIILIIIALFTTFSHFQPEHFDSYQDSDFITGKYRGEQQTAHIYDYLPKTAHSVPDELASFPIFHATDLEILTHTKTSNNFSLSYHVPNQQDIILALYFYPGWEATLDGEALEITSDSQYGFVTFDSPPGEHQLNMHFYNTPLRQLSNHLSLLSLVVLGLVLVYNKRHAK